ncbi:hypothetical protein [Sporomusa acidovorans]|uniref:hypothetical protein n=1 Tax=Sporomusa acidovorans TaxID=112900 RepID=UPI0008891906|nr:hypothetical protein [Sporomusa acidovorans]OZC22145.1 hypothetical protein SPACI_15920 [Sporomusa acidovorans DSM 3132]SDF88796.1 hypothetical protein SAMN04488499_11203 [Sporomusa acidovorans]
MKIKGLNFKEQETNLYERIRELSDEFDRQNKAGKDITDIAQRLEKVLEEFLLFRQ